jgi:hypothetical protein
MRAFLQEEIAGAVQDAGELVTTAAGDCYGVFRDQYEQLETGVPAEGLRSTLVLADADVARLQLRKDVVVTVRGQTFKIRRIEPMVADMSRAILANQR